MARTWLIVHLCTDYHEGWEGHDSHAVDHSCAADVHSLAVDHTYSAVSGPSGHLALAASRHGVYMTSTEIHLGYKEEPKDHDSSMADLRVRQPGVGNNHACSDTVLLHRRTNSYEKAPLVDNNADEVGARHVAGVDNMLHYIQEA